MANSLTKITTKSILDGTIATADIADNAITGAKLNADSVSTSDINDDAVTGAKIADDAINSEHYTDGSIDTAHIADNQVTGDKLADDITLAGTLTIPDTITHTGDTNTKIRFPAADTVSVETGGSERLRVDSSGRLLAGTTSSRSCAAGDHKIQIEATSTEGLSLTRTDVGAGGTNISFIKTRNGAIVQSGDDCGAINWFADDGTDTNSYVARIQAVVDGTPGSNDTPGRISFQTTSDGGHTTTERMLVQSDGHVKINDGNLVIGTAGHGIDFSATANSTGSVDHELFEDYEEGTFTPTVYSTAQGNFTHGSQIGIYTKVGRQVHVSGVVQATVGGTETGSVRISGFPFTSLNSSGNYGQLHTTDYGNFDSYTGTVGGYLNKGDTIVLLMHAYEGSSATIATSDWGTNTYIYFNMSYMAA